MKASNGRKRSSSLNYLTVLIGLLCLLFVLQHLPNVNGMTFSKRFLGNNCTRATWLRDCGEELICDESIGKCNFCTNTTQCINQLDGLYANSSMKAISSTVSQMIQCRRSIFNQQDLKNYKIIISPATENIEFGVCYHKDLFPKFSYLDAISTMFSFLGSILSSVAGIGGGGVIVPLLESAGQFPPQLAIPISKTMIFGAGK